MILVSHIKCSLIHGRKPICYRETASCAQLKSTVPVIATIRIRIECPIAGQEIQVSTAIRRRGATAHPDPAARVSKRSSEIRRRVEYRIGNLDESGSSITNDPAVVWILVLMRGPSDIDHTVDQGKTWPLVFLSGIECDSSASVCCAWDRGERPNLVGPSKKKRELRLALTPVI